MDRPARFGRITSLMALATLVSVLIAPGSATAAGVSNGMIAYETGGSSYRIWTMNPDGSARTQLDLSGATYVVAPQWSPDGNWLMFVAGEVSGGDRDFAGGRFKIRVDGSELTRLGDRTPGKAEFSPDGKLIAFLDGSGGLSVMNADGTGVRKLPYPLDEIWGGWDWAPDGRIVFGRWIRSEPDVAMYISGLEGTPEGGTTQRLMGNNWGGGDFEVSPDGTRILFAANAPVSSQYCNSSGVMEQPDVFVVNLDGSNRRNLTNTTTTAGPFEEYPRWSPDGQRIVYQGSRIVCRDGLEQSFGPEIYVMNADGSGQTRLITDDNPEYYHYGGAAWQPCTSATITCVSEGGSTEPAPPPSEPTPAPSPSPSPSPGPSQPPPSPGGGACPAGQVPEDGFSDVPSSNVHESAIDCLVWWEIAAGVGGGRYAPDRQVTRDQMATFIARTMAAGGVALPQDPPDRFSDDNGSPHELAINQLAALGVVSGTGTRSYSPTRAVSRDAMATFLVRAYERTLGGSVTASRDYFSDDQGNVHEGSINKSAEMGFASGTGAGTYSPSKAVRRDQMGSFLSRVLDAFVADGVAAPPGSSSDGGSNVTVDA